MFSLDVINLNLGSMIDKSCPICQGQQTQVF